MRFDLIVGFVNPKITEKVIKTAKNAGATGDVIIQGKGSGIEQSNFWDYLFRTRQKLSFL